MVVSFDLFGTLLSVDTPADPAAAVARVLADRGVSVPHDWETAYRTAHVDVPAGAESPLSDHVRAALASRGVDVDSAVVSTAVREAFDPGAVRTRPGADRAVANAAERGPVAVLSNCSVAGLVGRSLARSSLDDAAFDAVVASVDCGWRKPDRRAFAAVAEALNVPLTELVHVGDDPETDGGADAAGAHAVLLSDAPLVDLPEVLDQCPR